MACKLSPKKQFYGFLEKDSSNLIFKFPSASKNNSIFMCFLMLNEKDPREFPGHPVVRTLCFHCQGPGFDPWLGN